MDKVTKYLNIVTLAVWLGLLISLFFLDYNANSLRQIAVCSSFVVVMDLIFAMLEIRDKRIKREALVKRMQEFIEEKQGDE